MEKTESARIFGLDFMRAIAILAVLVGHMGYLMPESAATLNQLLALSSFFGVEIFFVLSGFLIGGILLRDSQQGFSKADAKNFLYRRWLRTLPNYYVVLFIHVVIALAGNFPLDAIGTYFVFLQNWISPIPIFFTESWSLAVEEWAYLILAAAFFLIPIKGSKRKSLQLIVVLCLLGFIAKAGYHLYYPSQSAHLDFWNLNLKGVVAFRLDAIFIGVAFAWFKMHHGQIWRNNQYVSAGIGMLLLIFLSVGVGAFRLFIERYPFFWNVLYLPITSLCFAFFLPILSFWKRCHVALADYPVKVISRYSYALYLVHYSLVLHWVARQNFPILLQILAYGLLTIFFAWLLYVLVERPVLGFRDKYHPR